MLNPPTTLIALPLEVLKCIATRCDLPTALSLAITCRASQHAAESRIYDYMELCLHDRYAVRPLAIREAAMRDRLSGFLGALHFDLRRITYVAEIDVDLYRGSTQLVCEIMGLCHRSLRHVTLRSNTIVPVALRQDEAFITLHNYPSRFVNLTTLILRDYACLEATVTPEIYCSVTYATHYVTHI